MDRLKRTIIRKDTANNNSTFSPRSEKRQSLDETYYFINYETNRVICMKNKDIIINSKDSGLFPPLKEDETIEELRDRDEISEVSKTTLLNWIERKIQKSQSDIAHLTSVLSTIVENDNIK